MEFRDARAKIRRAEKHLFELDDAIGEFRKTDFFSIREIRDSHTGEKCIEYGFTIDFPADEFALIVGDIVHNLKCALDYSWIHAVTKMAPNCLKGAKFPVYPDVSHLEVGLRDKGIKSAAPTLYNFVVSDIKPYSGGNRGIWPVHRLGLRDKHNLLVPIFNVGINDIALEDNEGCRQVITVACTRGPGPRLYRKSINENQHLQYKGTTAVNIVFHKGVPTESMEVQPVLRNLSEIILCVVKSFESFLEAQR